MLNMTKAIDLDATIANLERMIAELKSGTPISDNKSKVLKELDDKGTLTMKDVANLLNATIQTAHVISKELAKRKQAVLVYEPWAKNHRLRIVSTKLVPLESIFSPRVGKS